MSEEGAIYKRLYVQALEERDALRARAEKAEAEAKQLREELSHSILEATAQLVNAKADALARAEKAEAAIDCAILIALRTYWPMGDETQYAAKVQEIKALAGKGE